MCFQMLEPRQWNDSELLLRFKLDMRMHNFDWYDTMSMAWVSQQMLPRPQLGTGVQVDMFEHGLMALAVSTRAVT